MPSYRFGKHPPKVDYRTLRFKSYRTPAIPAPPAAFNVLTPAFTQSSKPMTQPSCSPWRATIPWETARIAALAHAETVYHGILGKQQILAKASVVKLYMHLTGGVDSGLNELDVLNYWRQNPVSADKIINYVSIEAKNHTHVQLAIQLFGGVYLGFQVQQNAVQEFDNHQPWAPGPLTQDGHAVYAVAYDQNQLTVLTWGNTQLATWAWWDECVDEAYAILPPEAQKNGFAPGFNYAQLETDLSAVAS
jgi:hypothetical protein